jgi:hypothetical protein
LQVETFGASTVKSIIDYKWKRFARKQIYTKACVYLLYVVLFTVSINPGAVQDESFPKPSTRHCWLGIVATCPEGVLPGYRMLQSRCSNLLSLPHKPPGGA